AFLVGRPRSGERLTVSRSSRGGGGGASRPVATTVVGDLSPLAQRARIQGLMSMMWALASLTGPPLGGFLVAAVDWPWVFWASIPFGLVVALLVACALQEQVVHRPHQLDWWGAATLAAGVSALLLALFEFSGAVERSPLGAGPLLLLALGLLGFFLWWEARAPEALLPLPLFRLPIVGIGCILSFITGAVAMGIGSYSTLFV